MHMAAPLVVVWGFVLHRLAGRRIRWRTGFAVVAASLLMVVGFDGWHRFDASRPRPSPKDGAAYYEPSLARTANGAFIPESSLSQNDYCISCHPDAYRSWAHSAHAASSFNNPMYAFSVRETRRRSFEREEMSMMRDSAQAAMIQCRSSLAPLRMPALMIRITMFPRIRWVLPASRVRPAIPSLR